MHRALGRYCAACRDQRLTGHLSAEHPLLIVIGAAPPAVPGTYGWDGHAADVLAASSRIGFERFALVGHSMGALVGLVVARRAPQRLRAVVLIDAVTTPDPAAGRALITTGRVLNASYPSCDRFRQAAREVIVPWNRRWDR